MFKHQGLHVFGGLLLAAALTGCGSVDEAALPQVSEDGQVAELGQSISLISGYDLRMPAAGPYTITGFLMPRWTAPTNHSPYDYITLAQEGWPNSQYVDLETVGAGGVGAGVAGGITAPAGIDLNARYEMRYFLNTGVLAAKTATFSVKQIPSLACGASFSGGDLPTVHNINVGKTAGTASFYHDAISVKDRFVVYSSSTGQLLFDSGCISGGQTIPLTFTSADSTLRVAVASTCEGNAGTGFSFRLNCAL
ncbi:MAG TPA: hypothetical protein VEU33_34945 [Archangium sp.]|nr:hypothetical protein [Archangium sp.]